MTNQLPMFQPTHAGGYRAAEDRQPYTPAQPSDTSQQAAREVRHSANAQEHLVETVLRTRGKFGATDEEIYSHLVTIGAIPNTTPTASIRRARIGLMIGGSVVASQFKRRLRSGKEGTVWVWGGAL